MVARPLWERKAVGSNPATPTTCAISRGPAARSPRATGFVIAFGACRRCRYYASCMPVCLIHWISTGRPPGGESAGAVLAPAETKKSAPKETEP